VCDTCGPLPVVPSPKSHEYVRAEPSSETDCDASSSTVRLSTCGVPRLMVGDACGVIPTSAASKKPVNSWIAVFAAPVVAN
jgi:hypothetical protein